MKNLLWILFSWPLMAATIFNGQTFIALFHTSFSATLPHTTIDNLLIIPIAYTTKPATIQLRIDKRVIKLAIHRKHYPKEFLRVAPSKVSPPKSLQRQIAKEFQEAKKIYATITPQSYIHKPFILPIHSKITDKFGVERIFNGKLANYHSGTDFKASVGTPVHAINDGIVVLAKKRYYAGGSLIIDHGRGIYSCYFHLSRFNVRPGQKVTRGQIIALSGKSGRVTGPHLHLTIKVRGISVDPVQFIKSFNKHFTRLKSLSN